MSDEGERPTGTVSMTISPEVIEVPVFTLLELQRLVRAIDEHQATGAKLRAEVRKVMKTVEAAIERWGNGEPPVTDE